jgi:hypothetical protein
VISDQATSEQASYACALGTKRLGACSY